MSNIKLGVRLESLGLPLRRALQEAERMGVAGIQVDSVGDLSPNQLSQTGRREFRHLLRAHNLELSGLNCPLRRGLDTAENQEPRIEHVQKVMSLSFDLGPRIVIVQPAKIPTEQTDPRLGLLFDALAALGRYGDRTGTVAALETGLESGENLRDFLGRFDTAGLGANLNPANLVMHGFDAYAAAQALRGKIVHAQAADARSASASRAAQEVPLGHGDIDWMQFLGVLEEVEYRGWLVVLRESGNQRLVDVAGGVKFLRRFIST
jgi:sugar phosphate isomerase/epimerase